VSVVSAHAPNVGPTSAASKTTRRKERKLKHS